MGAAMTPGATGPSSGRDRILIAGGLVALTVAAFAGVWRFGFVNFDDPQYVSENPMVLAGLRWSGIVWAFTTGHAANWHPVTWLSHMLDVTIFGPAPGPAHAVNLVLHVANVLLLFEFLRRTTDALWRSAIVAALFAVHPLHVESVAWIAERKDVLSTCFGLLTMIAYVEAARRPRIGPRIAMLACFTLGLMAKPMLVTLPVVLLAIDVWPLRRTPSVALLREKLPLFGLALLAMIATVVTQGRGGAIAPFNPYPLGARVEHAVAAYVSYLVESVWPTKLAVFYPLPLATATWTFRLALVVIVAVTVEAVRLRRSRPYIFTGWIWYVVMLLPVIGLVQVGGQAMADRYTYLSLVGVLVMVVWTVADLTARRRAARAAASLAAATAVIACAVMAHRQLQTWRDSLTLWSHALDVTTDNYRAHNAVGALLVEEGRFDEAIAHLREAVRIEPLYADAHNNLGAAIARTGRFDAAAEEYRVALRISPGLALAHNNLGLALARLTDLPGAIRELREAARLAPDWPDFHYNLAVLLASQGDRAGAVAELDAVLALRPGYPPAVRLRAQLGR